MSLLGVGDELPVAEMHAADDAWAAADDLLELLHGLEADALLGDDLLEVKRFAEGAAEVLPHGPGDALALGLRKLGESQLEVAERAFLPVETRGDQPPGEARSRRYGLERQGCRGCLGGPKYRDIPAGDAEVGRGSSLGRISAPGRGG